MKKYICLLFTLFFLSAIFVPRTEASNSSELVVVLNDQKVESDAKPFILDGRTLVGLRSVFEKMGAEIIWNAEEKSVSIKVGQKNVHMFIGNRFVFVEQGGKTKCYQTDVAPAVYYDRTYVPLRMIAELFDCVVDYYENSADGVKMALIYTPESGYTDLQTVLKENCQGFPLIFGNEQGDGLTQYYKMKEKEFFSLLQALQEETSANVVSIQENTFLNYNKVYTVAKYNESVSLSVLRDPSIGGPLTTIDDSMIVKAVYQPSKNRISSLSATERTDIKDYWSSAGYREENEARYQAYQQSTGRSGKDVIWRVNARLDLREYEDYVVISQDKLNNDPLVIINKYHKVPDGYTPPDLKKNSDGCILRSQTADAFDEMKRGAAAQGVALSAMSGYRSVEYQRNLYNGYLAGDSRANVDTYSARPGLSEHHTGRAIDIYGYAGSPQYNWVRDHCHEYGFIVRYTTAWQSVTGYMDEPWHIRYIGKEHSMKMKENNIGTLEEYVGRYGTFE